VDFEGKDPESAFSKMLRAKDDLVSLLGDKFVEAEELIASASWEDKYGDADCLLRGMLENDAIFDPTGTYDLCDKVQFVQLLTAAAYDTTATTLCNLLYCFWRFPEETEKVRRAILSHPQLSDPETVFTFAMLKDCNELECFLSEVTRWHSPVPAMAGREIVAEEGLDFGGTVIPKGTALSIPIKWLHLNEQSWRDAEEFEPSRFDKSDGRSKAERGDLGRYNNIPFATGLHKCLGQNLAMLEMRLYSVLLLRDYEFELDEQMLSAEGTVNGMQTQHGLPHFNVYLKLRKRQ
jgi:cytochrome P450